MSLLQHLESPLVRRALLEAVMVGALCGAVGVHVLLRRLPFFTLALSHATLPGVVLASMAGVSLFAGGAAAAAVVVLTVGAVGSARRLDVATATGVALSFAFATGVLLQSVREGGAKDLAAFLVGDVLTTSAADLRTTVIAGTAVLLVLVLVHKEVVFGAFDPDGAGAAGYRLVGLDLIVLGAVALTVVTSVRAAGTIQVVTLLVAPALAARAWSARVAPMMVLGACFGALAGGTGIAASSQWGLAGGAAVTLSAVVILVVASGCAALYDQRRHRIVTATPELAAGAR